MTNQPKDPEDWASEKVESLLPCLCASLDRHISENMHCPLSYAPGIAAVLREAEQRGLWEAAKAVCSFCRNEYKRDDQPPIPHFSAGYNQWIHGEESKGWLCYASEIHAAIRERGKER